jgi:abortive infection bacteriophage resistance protein
LSLEYGPWWFQHTELFRDIPALVKTLESIRDQVERSKETFIKEHRKIYKNDLRFPPAWKTLELTSLGGLSRLYGNLKNNLKIKDTIAQEYGAVNHTYLPSWLQSITQIRNICAHHGRLWNKNLPGTLKLLSSPPNSWIKDVPKQHEFQYLYVHLCILKYLIDIIHPRNRFKTKLVGLLERYPNIDEKALGIKDNWLTEDLWL